MKVFQLPDSTHEGKDENCSASGISLRFTKDIQTFEAMTGNSVWPLCVFTICQLIAGTTSRDVVQGSQAGTEQLDPIRWKLNPFYIASYMATLSRFLQRKKFGLVSHLVKITVRSFCRVGGSLIAMGKAGDDDGAAASREQTIEFNCRII